MIEPGYYWIRDAGDWLIALFNGSEWDAAEWRYGVDTIPAEDIGPKIERPSHLVDRIVSHR